MSFNLSLVHGFDWDDGNVLKNVAKHRVEPAEAEQLFFNVPLIITLDLAHSGDEQRYQALGRTNEGRLLFAAFTLRGEETPIRVISVRDMHARERKAYAAEA